MMEHNNNANTSMIENFLYKILKGKVSKEIYISTRPSTINEDLDDFVVVDCDLPIIDRGSQSIATVYIFLYARPLANGTKNVAKLAKMEQALNSVIDTCSDKAYSIVRHANGADYDSGINWHNNFVHLIVKVL